MTDKHGKAITPGCTVKLPDGTKAHVSGTLSTRATLAKASEVEVIDHQGGAKAADGDSIIWGS
jgi:hypothetical protein